MTIAPWIAALNAAVASSDPAETAALFDPGGFWRDFLALDWTLQTVEGAPAIIIADADGRVINPGGAYDWRTARTRRPQEFADFLAVYAEVPAP